MDDMTSKLGDILKDPASMEKIRALASMLGGSGEKEAPAADPPPEPAEKPAPPADADVMRTVMKLAPALSRFRREDSATRLLRALRPFLSEKRQKKLDESLRLMQLVRAVPFLKNSGIF